MSEIKTKVPNKYRSRLNVGYETPVPRQMMLRFELSINNGKRCKEWVKKESKCDLRVFDPIGRNLLNEINRAEEWLHVEEQEVPNEMGNTVYLPLFSVIRSFIAIRSVAFFFHSLSLVESRAKHLSFALFLIAVVFRLQRCDQDSYITGHSDTMHVHTSGHMWIFLNESFIFCFTVAFNRTGKKLLDIFVLDGRLSAAKEQISSWNTTTKGPTRMKKLQMSCYWSQSSSFILQLVSTFLQFTLHICWCLHTDRHTCTQTNKKSCFLLDWSTNVIKSAAKPSDQCKQTIK